MLVPAESETQAQCKRFRKSFELSNMKIQTLRSQAEGRKHKRLVVTVSVFIRKPQKSSVDAENITVPKNNENDKCQKQIVQE